MARPLLLLGVAALTLLAAWSSASAAPTIVVDVVPDAGTLFVEPGTMKSSDLRVTVTFKEMACSAGAKAGLDLIVTEGATDWAGASLYPAGGTYTYPKETKTVKFEAAVDEDSPRGVSTTFKIQPAVHDPSGDECPGASPAVQANPGSVVLRVPTASATPTTASGPATSFGSSPDVNAFVLLLVLGGLGAAGRLRRQ